MNISNTGFNYEKDGLQYSAHRQTEPEIAKYIHNALDNSKTVINIGAGTGSYEPKDRYVVAIEPSGKMRKQRITNNENPAINATAEAMPFDDQSFDAATAFLTIHHWPDIAKGLKEIRRITRGQILIMTYDPDALNVFWNADYFPEVIEVERHRYPPLQSILDVLGKNCIIKEIPVPLNCIDGFQEAFYGRPEYFLSKEVRSGMSAWGFISQELQEVLVNRLKIALSSGAWDRSYGHLRTQPFFTGALRLIIAKP